MNKTEANLFRPLALKRREATRPPQDAGSGDPAYSALLPNRRRQQARQVHCTIPPFPMVGVSCRAVAVRTTPILHMRSQ